VLILWLTVFCWLSVVYSCDGYTVKHATICFFILYISSFQHMMNSAAFKARTISRNKHRDKRSAVLGC